MKRPLLQHAPNMARLMLFLITCREFFCLGLFSRRALRCGTFCSPGWKKRSPCCVVMVAHPHIQIQPRLASSPGMAFSLCLPQIVWVWPLNATRWQQEPQHTLWCACACCSHSACSFPCCFWNGASSSSKSTCKYWGSHYFLAVPLDHHTLSHFLFPALLRVAT